MELLIIRHAKAEDHGHPAGDAARALVKKGSEQAARLGRFLRRTDRLPDVVLTSPLVRARQTAERLCESAGLPEPVEQPWLACGMVPETAVRELKAFSSFDRVAIVGHEPDLSALIAHWVGAADGSVEMKKAGLTGLALSPGGRRARLLFHVPPSMQGE
ncbi:MAG: SixA phosphatase family protein [Verrucomicrobiales bacterium]